MVKKTNYVKNIVLAFVLFLIGQVVVDQLGKLGIWIILGLVVVYYVWWVTQKRGEKDK